MRRASIEINTTDGHKIELFFRGSELETRTFSDLSNKGRMNEKSVLTLMLDLLKMVVNKLSPQPSCPAGRTTGTFFLKTPQVVKNAGAKYSSL